LKYNYNNNNNLYILYLLSINYIKIIKKKKKQKKKKKKKKKINQKYHIHFKKLPKLIIIKFFLNLLKKRKKSIDYN